MNQARDTYSRETVKSKENIQVPHNSSKSTSKDPTSRSENTSDRIPIDGFRQVLEMLRVADPSFRDSLLRRLAQKDIALANSLRRDLNSME